MTTFLLFDDALRSPEMRHEIAEPVMDPLIFLDHEDRRIVVAGPLELKVLAQREDVIDEVWNENDFGRHELVGDQSFPAELIGPEIIVRALARLASTKVVVPASFHVAVADYLRSKGIEVTVDDDAWTARRRRKAPWELEGIERAQRAAEMAMTAAARMLRDAEPTADGLLRFEGEILTAELIRDVMITELVSQGADSTEIIIQSGDAFAGGHDPGRGPIFPDRSCIIDCFPRDRKTGAFSDMTRTFVPGTPSEDLRRLHEHCRKALEIAMGALRPGAANAYQLVAEYFHSEGFPTQAHHHGPGLDEGFFHGLGHGVGLQVHEPPQMGRRSDPLVDGDVVAVEPGLYFRGIGGVRLEDTVIVTDGGVERFTEPYPYDLLP